MQDTICAISTSLGVGAISIIRCSGNEAINNVNKIFDKNINEVKTHTIHYGHIVDKNEMIDEVLVSVMRSPKTFTTEDIVEINCHGGIATTNKVLELLLDNGCRLAEPGEFTKRAFLNGRIDLLEAESVSDLINAETDKARKLSINGVSGKITEKINIIRKKILEISANIEVNIDYPEYEDAIILTNKLIKPRVKEIKETLEIILKDSNEGKIIKKGLDIALIGKPNVGKSSILNALLDEEKAIVTKIAGTTRDIVEGKIILNGIILNFIDTAGIRKTNDVVEKIGVDKSFSIIDKSDLVILVLNNSEEITKEEKDLIKNLKRKKHLIFINKDDLKSKLNVNSLDEKIILGNTKNKNGLDTLKKEIVNLFNLNELDTKDFTYLSNSRQISLMKQAIVSLNNCLEQINNNIEIDLLAIDLKECFDYLGSVIGVSYKDELLDEIFANFCLGK